MVHKPHPTKATDLISKAFGLRMRELRKQKGLSQDELARLCNLHRTFIGRIERGETNITLRNVYKMAAGLDISLSEFFAEEGLRKYARHDKSEDRT